MLCYYLLLFPLLMVLIMAPDASATLDSPRSIKTVYLIRHAESEENRRIASLSRVTGSLYKFSLPSSKDIFSASTLLNVPAQVDSDVSSVGERQIQDVAIKLKDDDFLAKHNISLVAHSPLKRARQTAEGMLGCAAPDTMTAPVIKVEETSLLIEKTPAEWLPYNSGSLASRIGAFEAWLGKQPHDSIAIVGHSQFFKAMLGLSFKFGNCEVWQLTFDPSSTSEVILEKTDETKHGNADEYTVPRGWSKLKRLYTCNVNGSTCQEDEGNEGVMYEVKK
jgi:broad specificity phosphatase PhoE